jgi:flagellar basal-body rod protein FlgB
MLAPVRDDRIGMSIEIPQTDMLSRLLDATTLRHRVISNNLANLNTPGFHRQEVSFEEAFSKEIQRGGDARAAEVRPHVVESRDGTVRQDGNNVDLDKEMGDLNKNALVFNATVQLLMGQIARMRAAITGH